MYSYLANIKYIIFFFFLFFFNHLQRYILPYISHLPNYKYYHQFLSFFILCMYVIFYTLLISNIFLRLDLFQFNKTKLNVPYGIIIIIEVVQTEVVTRIFFNNNNNTHTYIQTKRKINLLLIHIR